MLHVYVLLMRLSEWKPFSPKLPKPQPCALNLYKVLPQRGPQFFCSRVLMVSITVFSSACQQHSLQFNKRMGKVFSLSFLGPHHLIHHLVPHPLQGRKKKVLAPVLPTPSFPVGNFSFRISVLLLLKDISIHFLQQKLGTMFGIIHLSYLASLTNMISQFHLIKDQVGTLKTQQ